jgi:outer membrane protein assembly factor BamD
MSSRFPIIALVAILAITTACTNKKVTNPLAKIDSKQPDVVLFDRGMDAMKHNHFDVARLDMQTLINTYPDSEYIARAKLALADSWYAEGGTAGLAQAEQEYTDFKTFFPNMPEAAEAQLKIANIHFSQMEKPDRDFTHAVRAEQEYRAVILQYPDNPKMVAEARTKLLEVQEVIAEREFRVGRFYYLRQTFPAAIARLQSLVNRYPLYSKADETLYLLGQSYEGEIAALDRMGETERKLVEEGKVKEAQLKRDDLDRERLMTDFTNNAAAAYKQILTRYPVMERSDDAKARLLALHQEVPRPTKAMLAQNKAEEAARHEKSLLSDVTGILSKRPDVSAATTVGNPTLQEQEPISPTAIVEAANRVAAGSKPAEHSLTGAIIGTDTPAENQPAPRSDDPAAPAANAGTDKNAPAAEDPNELKTIGSEANADANAPPDPNELKPNVASDTPAPAPQQVNELGPNTSDPTAQAATKPDASGQELADDQMISSSKHKKKKGLSKIIPGGK